MFGFLKRVVGWFRRKPPEAAAPSRRRGDFSVILDYPPESIGSPPSGGAVYAFNRALEDALVESKTTGKLLPFVQRVATSRSGLALAGSQFSALHPHLVQFAKGELPETTTPAMRNAVDRLLEATDEVHRLRKYGWSPKVSLSTRVMADAYCRGRQGKAAPDLDPDTFTTPPRGPVRRPSEDAAWNRVNARPGYGPPAPEPVRAQR